MIMERKLMTLVVRHSLPEFSKSLHDLPMTHTQTVLLLVALYGGIDGVDESTVGSEVRGTHKTSQISKYSKSSFILI